MKRPEYEARRAQTISGRKAVKPPPVEKCRPTDREDKHILHELKKLGRKIDKLLMTQEELKTLARTAVAGIKTANEGIARVVADEDKILAKLKELEEAVKGDIDQEATDILNELSALVTAQVAAVQALDDKIPETPTTPIA